MSKQANEVPLVLAVLVNLWNFVRCWPVTAIVLVLTLRFVFKRYVSPLRKYPGPFLASGTRLYSLVLTWRGRTHEDHVTLHQRYGPIVRIQPNQLSFASPEAAREILAPGKGFNKTDFYWVFPPYGNPDIFTEVREEVHAMKKRFVSQPYSLASFQALTPWIDSTIQVFCGKLDSFANKSSANVNLGNYLHYLAFDVLGQVAFSTDFGFTSEGRDIDGAIAFIDTVQLYDGVVGQIPVLDYFLRRSPVWDYLPFVTPLGNNYITRTALGQLVAHENDTAGLDRRDLLGLLLEAHEKNPDTFDKGSVFAVAHGAIGAGSDSTASTMQTFMWNVLSNRAVYDTLTTEILTADAAEALDIDGVVTWQNAQKRLPYFQACLKEAMRIGPAVGLAIYRRVPASGAEIDGTYFPGGTEVAVNAWVLHRDKAIFGDDADVFRPERWLIDDDVVGKTASEENKAIEEARIKRMDRYMFQFGGGSHVCIGRNLALLEMNKVLPQILRRYKMELVHPGRQMKRRSTFFVVQEGLEVKIQRRT